MSRGVENTYEAQRIRMLVNQANTLAVGFLHGLFYLQPLAVVAGLALLTYMLMNGSVPSAALNYSVIRAFCLMMATLVICEFFRQRFYLDRQNEWGWHWRAGLLQLSKWPYFLLALYQVLSNQRVPYVLTSKVRRRAHAYVLLPHVLVSVLIVLAWIVGAFKAGSLHLLLHLSAAEDKTKASNAN